MHISHFFRFLFIRIILIIAFQIPINSYSYALVHPRGLIKPDELATIRQKIRNEPFASMVKTLEAKLSEIPAFEETVSRNDIYLRMKQISLKAAMYLFTGAPRWANDCYGSLLPVLNDTAIFTNPLSFGLTRSLCLRETAIAYDFCYNAWNENQRNFVNQKLLESIYSIQASMGTEANYNIESNWMGVRYASTCLASLVYDETNQESSRTLPILWDDIKRLSDHVTKNLYKNGWNGESMGYHVYDWSFIGPAIIALQNNAPGDDFQLSRYLPSAVNSLWALTTSTVAIENIDGHVGIKADLSDDNLTIDFLDLLAIGLRIYPDDQKPALAWMFNYLFNPQKDVSLYAILYYPSSIEPKNPEQLKWLNYSDPDQGVVIFRNRFRDKNDIVCTFSATSKRIRGHRGFDTNTLRIIGLSSIWIAGAGRTKEIEGQSNIFSDTIPGNIVPDNSTGELVSFKVNADGSGTATCTGSCMKVDGLIRHVSVDFSKKSGAEAVILESNSSGNGKLWRINTPEFNMVKETSDGFVLISPSGSSLKATFFKKSRDAKLIPGKVRYGGTTTRHNPGIQYSGTTYEFLTSLSYQISNHVLVVYTLQPSGKEHPPVKYNSITNTVYVGGIKYKLNSD
jgi:hypothetical protein